MTSLKLILRRARTLLWTAFYIVVVLLAVVVGVGRLLMPYSVHYQPELEQWLSGIFGQPVAVESFEGAWTMTGPRLTLRGLQLLRPGAERTDPEPEVEEPFRTGQTGSSATRSQHMGQRSMIQYQ